MKNFILLSFLILFVTGCTIHNSEVQLKKYDGDSAEGVSMIIKSGTLTSESTTILITDNSDNKQKHAYSQNFTIYKKVDNDWIQLEEKIDNKITTLENYFVNDSNELEMKQDWKTVYGNLSSGEYKIVKYLNDLDNGKSYSVSTNFVLNK